jgi:hypothetical protein
MPFALSKGVDSETAKRIRKSVTEAGGIVRIETETPFQESLSDRRKSTVVFRPGPSTGEEDASDSLFRKEKPKEPVSSSEAPPVTGLPEGYQAEPPPLDMIETDGGVVVMHPPVRFTPGIPRVSHREEYGLEPPVLPDLSREEVPQVLEFQPPEAPSTDPPPVVGTREHALWADEPSPEVTCFFPPQARIDPDRLLPPVLVREEVPAEDLFGGPETRSGTDGSPAGEPVARASEELAVEIIEASLKKALGRNGGRSGGPLRLFLCRPAPEDEDTVAEALRDVMGVSMRESWDLLRKAPALLKEYIDHTSAILTVHQLESRGVTVSLNRAGNVEATHTNGDDGGFRAWLTKNG